MDGYRIGGRGMNIMIVLLCLLLCGIMFVGAFYLAEYVVKQKHRVSVLEDSYREATDHIAALENENRSLEQQLDHARYEAQLNGERLDRPRAWNPSDPLNSATSRQ